MKKNKLDFTNKHHGKRSKTPDPTSARVNKDLPEDTDILFLTDLLLDIHRKYYQEDVKDVRDILIERKNIFKGRRLYLEKENPHLSKLISMHGGDIVRNPGESDIFVRDEAVEYRVEEIHSHHGTSKDIPIVSPRHIYQSVYNLRFLPLDEYTLGMVKHVEIESDGDTIDSIINEIEHQEDSTSSISDFDQLED